MQSLHAINSIEEPEGYDSDRDSIMDTEDSLTGNFNVVHIGDNIPGAMSKYCTKCEAVADYQGFKYGSSNVYHFSCNCFIMALVTASEWCCGALLIC